VTTGEPVSRGRMIRAWVACAVPPLVAAVPLAVTANPPAPYGLFALLALVSSCLLLVRAYRLYNGWSEGAAREQAAAAYNGHAVLLALRRERWPGLVEAPEPPLRTWLSSDTFRKFGDVDRWESLRPFGGTAGDLRVTGATAVLSVRYTSHSHHDSRPVHRHRTSYNLSRFEGLVLRTETVRELEFPATLFPMHRGWIRGRWDRFLHAAPSSYGQRMQTGDAAFESRFALHGPGQAKLLSTSGREWVERVSSCHGPVTVAWRGREVILAVACGAQWDESGEGMEVLRDALELLGALVSPRD